MKFLQLLFMEWKKKSQGNYLRVIIYQDFFATLTFKLLFFFTTETKDQAAYWFLPVSVSVISQ